jgi:hypothetical protein
MSSANAGSGVTLIPIIASLSAGVFAEKQGSDPSRDRNDRFEFSMFGVDRP